MAAHHRRQAEKRLPLFHRAGLQHLPDAARKGPVSPCPSCAGDPRRPRPPSGCHAGRPLRPRPDARRPAPRPPRQ
ncbi:hypothetical protein FBT96_10250 [Rhodobacter capsulatus]|uniref:Uncharacterized protein n=1 Tax=Rhodobacter capsulatus TaxID=1061 RepID=A0A4U1JS91_RHOCA|nr:hypothetical protein FBT96_10250 [Rhodobacter capsulatus]